MTNEGFLCMLCECEFVPGSDLVPCPRCGFTERMNAQYRVRMKALTKGRSGRHKNHAEWHVRQEPRSDGKGRVGRLTVIDRRQDLYHERVVDIATGETIHEVTEPLSEHREHGTAKHPHEDD